MKKLIFFIFLFFSFSPVFAETGAFVLSGSQIFPDFDYSNFSRPVIRSMNYDTGTYDTINYSFVLEDINVSLYEIKIILIYIAIGGTSTALYHLFNDWL